MTSLPLKFCSRAANYILKSPGRLSVGLFPQLETSDRSFSGYDTTSTEVCPTSAFAGCSEIENVLEAIKFFKASLLFSIDILLTYRL